MSDAKQKILNKKFKNKQCKIYDDHSDEKDSGHSQQDMEHYHKQSYFFMKTLKRDYKRLAPIYNAVIQTERERERRNIEEIIHCKKVYNQVQNEFISIKRKNWCRYCESEATYLSLVGKKFYCSAECEEKQMELINAIDNVSKTRTY